jgi:hypothetical protein
MIQAYIVLSGRIHNEMDELERLVSRAERALEAAHQLPDENDLFIDAVALNLHGVYTGLERIFHQIAATVDGNVPSSREWHRELLEQMSKRVPDVRPPVISANTVQLLDEFLRFRHVVRNVYTLALDDERITGLVQRARPAFNLVKSELSGFADFLDQVGKM